MNQEMSLERMLADLMVDEGAGTLPDQLIDQITSTTSRIRPLPRWLAVLREPHMSARSRVVVGMPTRQLALLGALLLLAAAIAIGIVGGILLRPQPAAEEWPGFRGDGSRAGITLTGPIGNPVVRWQFHAKGSIASDIAVASDLVVAPSDDGVLHGIDFATGVERWSFAAAAPMKGPYVSGGRVYVADGEGVIHALSLADGKPIWTSTERLANPSDLVVTGNRLFVGTLNGLVLGINTADGSIAWRTQVGATAIHSPAATDAALVVSNDALELAALDPATGVIRWNVPSGVQRSGTPVIVRDTVYLGSTADAAIGRLTAHDLATGAERWRIDQNIYTPSVSGGMGYTGSAVGRITAVDLATGTVGWVAQLNGTVRAPAIAGNVVYVAADREHRMIALDKATGGELSSLQLDGNVSCCIAVVRGVALLGTSAGTVYAIGGDGATLAPKALPSVAPQATRTTAPAASAVPTPSESPLVAPLVWTAEPGAPNFRPWGLTQAPDGRLWTSVAHENRFDIFTADGTFVESWGESGSGDGQFDLRRANGDEYGMVAFAKDGSFFVLDPGNRRIQAFDAKRNFVRAWGSFGNDVGQFNDPISIAVDGEGNLNVLDDLRQVIEVYTPAGKVARTVPAFPQSLQPNDGANQLAIGPNGHFFVSVVRPSVIAELDRDGTLIRTFGDGTKGFEFSEQPNRVSFDDAGRVYVAQGRERQGPGIAVFAPDGTYVGGFGPLGSGPSEMRFAWGLVVTKTGIYVTDPDASPELALKKFEPITVP